MCHTGPIQSRAVQTPSAAASGAPSPTPLLRSVRIVIADDDYDTVATLMVILRDEGHEVVGVHSGRDALEAAWHFDPDAVLVDIAMRDMSGWDLAREIRKQRGGERPLLIAISGRHTKTADRMLGDLVGFNHYLVKPYDTDALLALLAPIRTRLE